jgi:hypothetical protein
MVPQRHNYDVKPTEDVHVFVSPGNNFQAQVTQIAQDLFLSVIATSGRVVKGGNAFEAAPGFA